jgi:hypothetical protein
MHIMGRGMLSRMRINRTRKRLARMDFGSRRAMRRHKRSLGRG